MSEILLTHRSDGLYYKANGATDYEKMKEDSTVTVKPDGTVTWRCADDTISKILNINVNKNKAGTSGNWKDFWEKKPKKTDNTKRVFEGKVKPEGDGTEINGYLIKYKTADGGKPEVDPVIQVNY